ncbi:MAG: HIT family protein [Actinomycetota bacterium]|nr:HIT family protein [Actinomycetota bacterium]
MSELEGAHPDPDCMFCKIVARELPAEIIDSDSKTVAFMDINPATPGHALVIPRVHSKDLMEISDEDLAACTIAARRLAKTMADTLDPEGLNVLNCCGTAAWQTVFHFHLHVVPRREDDPLKLPWIPQPGDSAEIEKTAAKIRGEG